MILRRIAPSVTVTCLKIRWRASVPNVANAHLLTDVQDTWPLSRHHGSTSRSSQRLSKTEKNVGEMLALFSEYEEEEQEWVEEADAYNGNDDEWDEDI